MVGVTTVALIERRLDISRDLFSRYWRDVHGVMAARIPGFETYTQFHVTPMPNIGWSTPEPIEGIAIVTFASEENRNGLATSEISGHIHRDEKNVFRRALLYNLKAEDSRFSDGTATDDTGVTFFLVVPDSVETGALVDDLRSASPRRLDIHDLRSGDPTAWNETEVDPGGGDRHLTALIRVAWASELSASPFLKAKLTEAAPTVAVYRVDEAHTMVDGGYPTPVGLRGLHAVQTILEAGADNQLTATVVRAVYGEQLAVNQALEASRRRSAGVFQHGSLR